MNQLIQAAVGGALIGLAAVWLSLSLGKIAGISSMVANTFRKRTFTVAGEVWPLLFIIGLGVGGWLALAVSGSAPVIPATTDSLPLLVGGLLVGFGVRLGSGCTSGHGVCGIARISPRSFAATGTFLATGIITASLMASL